MKMGRGFFFFLKGSFAPNGLLFNTKITKKNLMNFFCAKKLIEMTHEIFQWISRKLENIITTPFPSNFS